MENISYGEIAFRLFLAVVLGGVVGFERERQNRPAGFRTHILVCVGSALVMLVSAYGFTGELEHIGGGVDPSRIAAQVVAGVGFLGAGTIIRHGNTITGLTTAASIWIVSGIGLAAGIGFYLGAVLTTLMVLVSLIMFVSLENSFARMKRFRRLWIRGIDQPGLLGRIAAVLGDMGINVTKVDLSQAEYQEIFKTDVIAMEFFLRLPSRADTDDLLRRVATLPGILEVGWEGYKD
ncbi:MAG: MgtC/SapB family protein [Dethiobacter sp.]|jgi:putative Mg2+ transporter-C (MgtC) family protein|nr:MAG: MgtC/SapB family protein [Dethiobacter sp.]